LSNLSKTPKSARLLLVAAALLLAVAPLLPIWRISLVAPQYPEGMGMLIRFNTIEGAKEHDLENINELNHYIGMRLIEPADMPELRFMPWIVVGLAVAGLGAAAVGRRACLYMWAGVFGASGVAGMADFWRRTYTFGHTLDFAHAAIQIPGLAYQPPLLGVKQIANFTASAWPASGGILIGVAALLTAAAVWRSRRGASSWSMRAVHHGAPRSAPQPAAA
jgi:copper chaperone NosL